jgi:hypothetical protein
MSPRGKEECKPETEAEDRRLRALEQAAHGGGHEANQRHAIKNRQVARRERVRDQPTTCRKGGQLACHKAREGRAAVQKVPVRNCEKGAER